MISVNNISLQRGGKILFQNASLKIQPGQRVALIGANGCGKSTLFQMLLGKMQADVGNIEIPSGLRIAHMAQEIDAIDRPAREYIIDGHARLRKLEAKLAEAEKNNDNNAIGHIHSELDALDAYRIHYQAEAIMLGLGFQPEDYLRPVASFSGGWRIRLNLARTLLSPSDILLLDEPTNHLDMEAIHWLEEWLQLYEGTVVLVSHDRDFIDAVAGYIAHIEDLQIHFYKGTYSSFENQRAEKLAQQQSLHEKQQARRAELQKFIDRFKAQATKAKQAQSRVKALERMQLVSAVREKSPYHFHIPHAEKTGSPLINWFNVNLGYGNTAILTQVKFSILPSMRIGLLGANGAGKSTLIKTLAKEQPVLNLNAGAEVHESEHLKIGYFAQHQLEALDVHASPLLHLQRLTPKATDQSMRDFLGSFRIIGDMAVNTIENFSGGEKARLALAIVAWQKPNLLLMDEPTNHLDIEMREALTEALQEFPGAVILVSHDRYLLRHCVDEFWLVEDGKIETFEGDLNDYYQRKKQQELASNKAQEKPKDLKKQNRQQAAQKRLQLAPLTKEIKTLESRIEKQQSRLNSIRHELADSAIYQTDKKDLLQKLLAEEVTLKSEIETLEMQWFEKQELLQQLEVESEQP